MQKKKQIKKPVIQDEMKKFFVNFSNRSKRSSKPHQNKKVNKKRA